MTNLVNAARPATASLETKSEEELYLELGARLEAIGHETTGSDRFDMVPKEKFEVYGPLDALKAIGKKFFDRWKRDVYNLFCGSSAEDKAARDQVASAFNLGKDAIIATVAAALAAYLGLAAGLAAVIAALAYRLFFKNTIDATCEYWGEQLKQA